MRFLPVILLLIAASCQPQKKVSNPLYLSSDSLAVSYTDCGAGPVPVVFLHGWCINKTYWDEQVKEFCPQYRVITIDIPGFGESGSDRDDWSIAQLGQDVADVLTQLQLENVILVGHSMSGDIALETALSVPNRVDGIIGVDNFKDAGFTLTDEIQTEIDGFINLLAQDFVNVAPAYAQANLFSPTSDSLVVSRVMTDFSSAEPAVAVPVLQSLFQYSEKKRLSGYDKKLVLINSNTTPTNTSALEELGLKFELIEIDGTGHYPMNEKPKEFNKALVRALVLLRD